MCVCVCVYKYAYVYIPIGQILDLHCLRLSNVNAVPFCENYTKFSEDNTGI